VAEPTVEFHLRAALASDGTLEVRARDVRDLFGYSRLTARARHDIDERLRAAGIQSTPAFSVVGLDDWLQLALARNETVAPRVVAPAPARPSTPPPAPRVQATGIDPTPNVDRVNMGPADGQDQSTTGKRFNRSAALGFLIAAGTGVLIGASAWTPMAPVGISLLLLGLGLLLFGPRPSWLFGKEPRRAVRVAIGGALIGLVFGVPACTTSVAMYSMENDSHEQLLTQAERAVESDDAAAVQRLWPVIAFAKDDGDEDHHHRWMVIAAYRHHDRIYLRAVADGRDGRWSVAAKAYGSLGEFRDAAGRSWYATARASDLSGHHLSAAVSYRRSGYGDWSAREATARRAEAAAIAAMITRSHSRQALAQIKTAISQGGIPGSAQLRRDAKARLAAARRDLAEAQARSDAGDYVGALSVLEASGYVAEMPDAAYEIRQFANDMLSVASGGGSSSDGGGGDGNIPNFDIPGIPFM